MCVYVCLRMCVYVCVRMCVYVCVRMCVYVCVRMCVHFLPTSFLNSQHTHTCTHSKLVRLQNLEIVWAQFRADNVSMVNISAEDIEGGNTKITLALIWHLIMHYFIVDASASRCVCVCVCMYMRANEFCVSHNIFAYCHSCVYAVEW
jgi:hypothetical protein